VLRHVVVFRWREGTSPDEVAAVLDGLAELPGKVPALRRYRFGADLGLSDGTWDFAVVADVDDAEGLLAYREHPAHQAILRERIQPILSERAAVQFTLEDDDA
jgi:hypothetical protein